MGSYAYSVSTTQNSSNAPTVQDNENPIVLTGSSGARANSDNISSNLTLSGNAQLNTLDGGAIAGAYDLTKSSVASVLDLTAKLLQQNSTNTSAYLEQVKTAGSDALKYISSNTNKEGEERALLEKVMIGAAVLGGLYIVFNFSKWGK